MTSLEKIYSSSRKHVEFNSPSYICDIIENAQIEKKSKISVYLQYINDNKYTKSNQNILPKFIYEPIKKYIEEIGNNYDIYTLIQCTKSPDTDIQNFESVVRYNDWFFKLIIKYNSLNNTISILVHNSYYVPSDEYSNGYQCTLVDTQNIMNTTDNDILVKDIYIDMLKSNLNKERYMYKNWIYFHILPKRLISKGYKIKVHNWELYDINDTYHNIDSYIKIGSTHISLIQYDVHSVYFELYDDKCYRCNFINDDYDIPNKNIKLKYQSNNDYATLIAHISLFKKMWQCELGYTENNNIYNQNNLISYINTVNDIIGKRNNIVCNKIMYYCCPNYSQKIYTRLYIYIKQNFRDLPYTLFSNRFDTIIYIIKFVHKNNKCKLVISRDNDGCEFITKSINEGSFLNMFDLMKLFIENIYKHCDIDISSKLVDFDINKIDKNQCIEYDRIYLPN